MALALLKKFSLAGIAEGWDESSFILYSSVKYGELKDLQGAKIDEKDPAAAADKVIKFVSDHFVSGKGMILADDGSQALGELSKDDIAELPLDTITSIFKQMTGQETDPKDTAPSTTPSSTTL